MNKTYIPNLNLKKEWYLIDAEGKNTLLHTRRGAGYVLGDLTATGGNV